jgi:hypothetical protein
MVGTALFHACALSATPNVTRAYDNGNLNACLETTLDLSGYDFCKIKVENAILSV